MNNKGKFIQTLQYGRSETKVRVKLDEVWLDEDIYPRMTERRGELAPRISKVRIDGFVEALRVGTKFPPILVQHLRYGDGEIKTALIDGLHRVKAYEAFNELLESEKKKQERLVESEELEEIRNLSPIEEVECIYWKDEVLDRKEWLTQLQLESARCNATHGLPLTREDMKVQARKICESNLDIKEQEIADIFGVRQQTVSNWVKDIKLRQKAERQAVIYRLRSLGWTEPEIAEKMKLAQSTISEKISDLPELVKVINSLLERGDTVEDVAEKLNLDIQLAWSIVLEGLGDLERLKKLDSEVKGLNCKPRPYDVWNFAESYELFGYEYEGRIPGQLVLQLLYFYTKQGNLVVDPMAGSGTLVDACLLMNRKCLAYDVKPVCSEKRVDIRVAEALEAIRNLKHKANLIFLDPPYFKKKEKEYGELSISSLPRDKYLDYFNKLARECIKKITPNGRVVLLMSDYTEEDPSESIFVHHYIERFEEEGFIVERIIQCPLSTQQLHPDFQIKFTESRKLGRFARNLVVFRASRLK